MSDEALTLGQYMEEVEKAKAYAARFRSLWDMPDESEYQVTEDTATMTIEVMNKFSQYDAVFPSTVWMGKRWTRKGSDGMYLLEYVLNDRDPRKCKTVWRKINLV